MEKCLLILVASEILLYVGGQWKMTLLDWCLLFSGRRTSLHWLSVERIFLTLVVSGRNTSCIGGHFEECPLYWWPEKKMSFTLVSSGENSIYIGGNQEKWSLL